MQFVHGLRPHRNGACTNFGNVLKPDCMNFFCSMWYGAGKCTAFGVSLTLPWYLLQITWAVQNTHTDCGFRAPHSSVNRGRKKVEFCATKVRHAKCNKSKVERLIKKWKKWSVSHKSCFLFPGHFSYMCLCELGLYSKIIDYTPLGFVYMGHT